MRFPFVIAVILTLIAIALPPLILFAAVNLVGAKLPPFGLLMVTVITGYYLGFEVASRFGPKPFTTPLATYLTKYKTHVIGSPCWGRKSLASSSSILW